MQLANELNDNEKVIKHLIAAGQKTENEYNTASSISNAHLEQLMNYKVQLREVNTDNLALRKELDCLKWDVKTTNFNELKAEINELRKHSL